MDTLQIDIATLGWLLFAAAGASSLLTLVVLTLCAPLNQFGLDTLFGTAVAAATTY